MERKAAKSEQNLRCWTSRTVRLSMPVMDSDRVTKLLESVNAGDEGAFDSLVAQVYGELRRMAGALMRGQGGQTLQPTALVNEAYLRLIQGEPRWDGRAHFFGAAA